MARTNRPSIFGKNLTSLLEERELSVREAARIAGVSSSTIVDWKSGSQPTDFDAVLKLAKTLSVSMCYLLTGEEDHVGSQPPPISAVFDKGEVLYNGIASIKIVALIPKGPKTDGELP